MTVASNHERRRRLLVGAGLVSILTFALLGSTASAHPLGNFSVNHLNQLHFTADGIVDDVVIDTAEIPTAQADSIVDTDGDGTISDAELGAHAVAGCGQFAAAVELRVDGSTVTLGVESSSFEYQPGQAGLQTTRLECKLQAAVDLSTVRSVSFADGYLTDRVGWHEITAGGDGVRLIDSPVPQDSVTNGLREYPVDLLSSPLDTRAATFDVRPGAGPSTVAGDTAIDDPRIGLANISTGFLSSTVDRVQHTFDDLVGRRDLTLGVGLLAIGLALVLGASHAVLPGHGKTVMAAYIAGRQGSVKDAVIVGATVTSTHTGGVLLLGLALTVSTSLAGETVLGYLGVSSGLLIAGLGLGLLVAAIRHRRTGMFGHGHSHSYGFDHGHDHGDGHDHSHPDGHVHEHRITTQREVAAVASAFTIDREALVRGVVVGGSPGAGSVAVLDAATLLTTIEVADSTPVPTRHDHDHPEHAPVAPHVDRRGLIGMGVAGGLVPSPSALIILLSAIALGRTWFGILLVIGYGAGMAATLTLAGVALVKVRDRYQRRMQTSSGRVAAAARRWGVVGPYFTAGLVLVVGFGLAIRSIGLV